MVEKKKELRNERNKQKRCIKILSFLKNAIKFIFYILSIAVAFGATVGMRFLADGASIVGKDIICMVTYVTVLVLCLILWCTKVSKVVPVFDKKIFCKRRKINRINDAIAHNYYDNYLQGQENFKNMIGTVSYLSKFGKPMTFDEYCEYSKNQGVNIYV